MDKAYNVSSATVTFTVEATIDSLIPGLDRLYAEGKITNQGIYNSLRKKLQGALEAFEKRQGVVTINKLEAFINEVRAQSGKHITAEAADLLIADAQWVINYPK